MSVSDKSASASAPNAQPSRPIHPLQRFLDNPWLLLALGLLIPILSYTVWGWISMASLPPATLP